MSRDLLYHRIEKRVDKMMKDGLLDEVNRLLRKYSLVGTRQDVPLLQTIGYKELADHIQDKITFEEAVRLIKRNTQRYAKRQFTWFNHIKNVHWIELPDDTVIDKCIELILKFTKSQ